jgi:hypothetical protein
LEGEGERGGGGIKSNEEVNMIKHIHVWEFHEIPICN